MNGINLKSFGSLGTKLIFITLLFFVLFSLTSVNAADNQTVENICLGDSINEDVSLDADYVEEEIPQEDDSPISNPEASDNDEILPGADLEDGNLNDLMDDINGCTGNEYKLKRNYVLDVNDDYSMPITKNDFTIDGRGHSINGRQFSNLLFLNGNNITLKNIKFIEGSAFPCYGFRNLIESVYINGTGFVVNCTFVNNAVVAALGFGGIGYVDNCSFMDNAGEIKGGAIVFKNGGAVKHSSFINNFAPSGAAIYTVGDLVVEDSYFESNYAPDGSNLFFAENGTVTVKNISPSYAMGKGFKELNNIIKNGQNIRLSQDYMYMAKGDKELGKAIHINGIEISKDNMVIDGRGHTISGEGLARIFKITANNVTLKNINFLNGFSDGNGGAICLEGRKLSLTIENCNFTNNLAKGNGGAVFGNATIRNSTFTNNTAGADGGAFCCKIGTVMNCVFSNGMAKNGAGIYAAEITCLNSTFEDNDAKECGGAICALRNDIGVSKFINNSANYGGAFYSDEIATIRNSVFSLNDARIDGGAGYMNHFGPNDDILDNCTFNNNSAVGNGGALYGNASILKIDNSKFSFNSANNGGSLYLKEGGELCHSQFDGNLANNEGDAIFTLKNLKTKSIVFENDDNDSNLIVLRDDAKLIEED